MLAEQNKQKAVYDVFSIWQNRLNSDARCEREASIREGSSARRVFERDQARGEYLGWINHVLGKTCRFFIEKTKTCRAI
jgi:hypothetical protein